MLLGRALLFSPLLRPLFVAASVSFCLSHLKVWNDEYLQPVSQRAWIKASRQQQIPSIQLVSRVFNITEVYAARSDANWTNKQLAKGASRKKESGVIQSTRGWWEEARERRQQAERGGTRRKLWTLPWSSGGETACVIRTETNGGGRREDRASGPLSTERWRLHHRAGVHHRGSVLLRRRNDGGGIGSTFSRGGF